MYNDYNESNERIKRQEEIIKQHDYPRAKNLEDLLGCTHCNEKSSYAIDWKQLDFVRGEGSLWLAFLRCPNCDFRHEVIINDDELIYEFDVWHEEKAEALREDLAAITRNNLKEEAELFAKLLEMDIIDPEDFLLNK